MAAAPLAAVHPCGGYQLDSGRRATASAQPVTPVVRTFAHVHLTRLCWGRQWRRRGQQRAWQPLDACAADALHRAGAAARVPGAAALRGLGRGACRCCSRGRAAVCGPRCQL